MNFLSKISNSSKGSQGKAKAAAKHGTKRSAAGENLVPASTPSLKLHKDASGDIATAATVTADCPADTTATLQAMPASVPQADSPDLLTRMATLERQMVNVNTELAATKAALKAQERNSMARENAIKDAHRQQVSQLERTLEYLNQRVRHKTMVMHGVPDTANLSKTADLERYVKGRMDEASKGRAPSISQSITAVSHMGKPGTGSRSVLVEYASSQSKHRAYAVSRELRRNGFHLSDELTPKQLQAQRVLGADAAALRNKGYRPWFRHGTLWYSNRGVQRQCKQGEALSVPVCPGAQAPHGPGSNTVPDRHPSPMRRDNGMTASVNHALGNRRPSRAASPTYAQAAHGRSAEPNMSGSPVLPAAPNSPAAPSGSAAPNAASTAAPNISTASASPTAPASAPAPPAQVPSPQ